MAKAEIIKHPIESIGAELKKTAWGAVLESIATVILGILLICWPDTVIKVVAYVVAAFCIIKGSYQIINYFLVKGQNDLLNNNLLLGVISVLLGLALFLVGEEIINIFRIVIGIWIIYEALVRINTSIKLHAIDVSVWRYVLILALVMMLLGVFVAFNSGAVVILIGWMMIAAGIIGLFSDIMFIQYVGKIADSLTGKTKKSDK